MSELLLKDFEDQGCVHEWAYVPLESPMDWCRLYYKPNEGEFNGFKFYAIEIVSIDCTNDGDHAWKPELTAIEILFSGIAYWDGVRHLYMGSEATDNYGYLYYPDIDVSIEIMKALRELSNKYCRE
jgi:hypothetical protein